MLAKIRAVIATLSIAFYLPIIIAQIYLTRGHSNGRWARKQCRWFFSFNRLHVERIGEYDKDAQLLVINHQSVTDIIYFEAFHPANICWVAKKQLGEIPLYGHALKGPDMILIDREDKNGIVFLLKEAKKALANHRLIAIFPEGTRSKGGEKFLPFKAGAKILASKLNLRIQPAVLINTRKLYNSSPMEIKTDKARVVLMEAYTPDFSDEHWYEKLQNSMHEVYLKHYHELNLS
ncbi:1-acylglycerol-3-phosphate O-acyltransferase [Helicobacter jaachi]|uniref:1-acyl-sn-glycerol-3-phosphate acyltransferase n=1 Tax=Helicobacter jaachi TaxID=1677920 RepID=A0A4U8T6P7_9HELI|nr:1-acylglycerol-3-phosphate O-acyltransferase [Helicobacter jaachi]TLD95148.1 1-acylglycerol-3-phosphate O-acyltransferase [Helicobacter jaachi]